MIPYIGDFAEDATIYHYFNTFDSNDPSASVTVTDLLLTDIFVYKDGNVADIVTDGATVSIDFDSRTGLHLLTIDTSLSADYAIGSDYMVMVNGITVDAATINAGIFTFSIENRFNEVNVTQVGGVAEDLPTATELAKVPKSDGTSTWNSTALASIQTEANDALVANHLDHLLAVDYDPASKPGIATALLNELVENDAGESRFTTNSLENAPGGTPSSALLQSTDILAYTSNTSFTLTTASPDDDAYNGQMIVITDQGDGTQKAVGLIIDYTGSSKTVTLDADPGVFTYANGDTVEIWAVSGGAVPLEIDVNGRVDVGSVAGTVQTAGDLAALSVQIDSVVDGIQTDLDNGVDGLGALSADIGTAQADLDTITGTDGVTLATAQALYAPATAASLATAQLDLDTITGADGVNLLTATQASIDAIEVDTGTTLDTAITAIKAKTDDMTFTKALELDVNTQSINGASVVGDGNGVPWDGA